MTVEGSDGQNQERSQDTAHNTRTDTLHTCTRDNFRENTLSTADYTRQKQETSLAEGAAPVSEADTVRSSFQDRGNRQEETIKRFLYTDLSQ